MTDYSYKTTLLKGVKYFVIFLLPVLIDRFVVSFPEIAQLTMGGVLVMLVNYLKMQIGLRLP